MVWLVAYGAPVVGHHVLQRGGHGQGLEVRPGTSALTFAPLDLVHPHPCRGGSATLHRVAKRDFKRHQVEARRQGYAGVWQGSQEPGCADTRIAFVTLQNYSMLRHLKGIETASGTLP